jgi:hypothetical protein
MTSASRPADGDTWQAVVDARLIDACERHARGAERLRRVPSLPMFVRAPKLHVEPSDWRAGFVAVREYEVPPALTHDLQQRMPQALLRDLFRPVHEIGWVERELVDGTGDRGGFSALAEARAARWPPALPRIEPGTRAVRAYQAWRRALLAERWQPSLADDEPRRRVII